MNDASYPQQPFGLNWRKSSRSQGDNNYVEVARDPDGGRWLRDTKDRARSAHYFTESEWSAFVSGVRNGEFD